MLELGKPSRRSHMSDGRGLKNYACYTEIMCVLSDETQRVDHVDRVQ